MGARGGWLIPVLAMLAPIAPRAQEPCEALRSSGIRQVADRLGLSLEQRSWLLAEAAAGRMVVPGDLGRMPDTGGETRELLESAFCWQTSATADGSAAARGRTGASLREARIRGERGTARADLRLREDHLGRSLVRGGVTYRRGGWSGAAGDLRTRWGMGLLLTTPGAESRGTAPLSPGDGSWRPALGTDPGTVRGGTLRWEGAAWRTWGAVIRNEDGSSTWAGVERRVAGSTWGLLLGSGPRDPGMALRVSWSAGPGRWAAEWARAGGRSSVGASWRISERTWRGTVSLAHLGAADVLTGDPAPVTATADFRAELGWRPGSGRFLRGLWNRERGPSGSLATRDATRLEAEVGERLGSGLLLSLLWRRQDTEAVGTTAVTRTLRGDLERTRGPWRLLVRVQERTDDGGTAVLLSGKVRRDGATSWEVRAAQIAGEGKDPGTWLYRRRPVDLYGWDRLGPGMWVGGWGRVPLGPVVLEGSLDARAGGWEGAAGLRVRTGKKH